LTTSAVPDDSGESLEGAALRCAVPTFEAANRGGARASAFRQRLLRKARVHAIHDQSASDMLVGRTSSALFTVGRVGLARRCERIDI